MNIRIYTFTHKEFNIPPDPMYVPLHVGAAPAKDAGLDYGYLTDDSGDNISDRNCYYSELTGMYWAWKNAVDLDYIGTCHYRRYLLNHKQEILEKDQILDILRRNDVITTKALDLNFSYYYGFGINHKPYYLDETRQVIADVYPDYIDDYDLYVNDNHTYFGNIMICNKTLYDDYCNWLFTILFELESRISIQEEDSYHRRIFGFISEFLWFLYVKHNRLRAYECKVGILGEKAEIKDIKSKIASLLEQGDFDQAKVFFLNERAKRPDIMMEASDIGGYMHACMELIAIAEFEADDGLDFLGKFRDFDHMIEYCNRLNRYSQRKIRGLEDLEDRKFLEDLKTSEHAYRIARAMFEGASDDSYAGKTSEG